MSIIPHDPMKEMPRIEIIPEELRNQKSTDERILATLVRMEKMMFAYMDATFTKEQYEIYNNSIKRSNQPQK